MELEKRLLELQDYIYRKTSYEKKLEDANDEVIYLTEKLKELSNKLDEEYIDRKDIEKKSIIYMWYDLFTSKGKKVSKLEYEYKIHSDLYKYIQTEIIELKDKLTKIPEYQIEYDKLLKEKEVLIVENEKEKYNKVKNLSLESTKYKTRIRDINEAIYVGNKLFNRLKYILDLLEKAKGWGKVDIFGRGLFMSITKTDVFKQTEEKVKDLHYLANQFSRQLKVLNFYMDLTIDSKDIIQLSDYYANGLYHDMKDKKKLINALDYITKGYELVNKAVHELSIHKEEYLKQLIEIEQNKNHILNS